MSGLGRRFDPAELRPDGGAGPSTPSWPRRWSPPASSRPCARATVASPTVGFEDRVMAAIAAEPAPRLLVRPGRAVRGGLRAARSSRPSATPGGVATGGGRPLAVRAQAFAFVLLVVLATGSLVGRRAVGAASLSDAGRARAQGLAPTRDRPAEPSPTQRPSHRGQPVPASRPAGARRQRRAGDRRADRDTQEPGDTAEPTETRVGRDADGEDRRSRRGRRGATETPEPDETDEPDETTTTAAARGPMTAAERRRRIRRTTAATEDRRPLREALG